MIIKVTEVLKVTADPTLLDDVDKLMITAYYNGKEYRVAIPFSAWADKDEFKILLREAAQKAKDPKKVTNLSEKWAGEYDI